MTPAPTPASGGDRVDYLARPFAQWAELGGGADDDTQFVQGLYLSVLGRTGDHGGVENYVKELGEGRTRRELLKVFCASPERLDLVSALHDLPMEA